MSSIGPDHGRWGQPSSTNVHIAASPSSIIPQYDEHSSSVLTLASSQIIQLPTSNLLAINYTVRHGLL